MNARCYDRAHSKFKYYGARGISVCPRWRNNFSAFCNDLGRPPSSRHTIDREDNDGNYEPGNCRWATKSQQNNNKRHWVFRKPVLLPTGRNTVDIVFITNRSSLLRKIRG